MTREQSVPAHLARLSPDARKVVRQLRANIRAVVPRATGTLSHGIPAYRLDEPLPLVLGRRLVKARVAEPRDGKPRANSRARSSES